MNHAKNDSLLIIIRQARRRVDKELNCNATIKTKQGRVKKRKRALSENKRRGVIKKPYGAVLLNALV